VSFALLLYIHLVTSSKRASEIYQESLGLRSEIFNTAEKYEFSNRLQVGIEYLPYESYVQRISTLDCGFSYAPAYWTSSSGAVPEMLACLIPVVTNDVLHFRNVRELCWSAQTVEDIASKLIDMYQNSDKYIADCGGRNVELLRKMY